jgi:hypothetical protein
MENMMTHRRAGIVGFVCLLLNGCCITPPQDVSANAASYPGMYRPGEIYALRQDVWTGESLRDTWHTGLKEELVKTPTELSDVQVANSQSKVMRGTHIRVVKLIRVCWDVMPLSYAHRIVPIGVIEDGPYAGLWVDLQPVSRLFYPQEFASHGDVIPQPDDKVMERIH